MLDALKLAKDNFRVSKQVYTIWDLDPTDMGAVNRNLRTKFESTVSGLANQTEDNSPPGWVVTGPAGSGKTHLLSSFCQQTRDNGGIFLLVDMTTVTDFWEKVRFDFVRSISPSAENAQPQILQILERVVSASQAGIDIGNISGISEGDLSTIVTSVLKGLYPRHGHDVQEYQDIVRAAFMIGTGDFDIAGCGNQWLQGGMSGTTEYKKFRFRLPSLPPEKIVAGLSWLISLGGGFSVLAFDQFDGIVKQHYLPGINPERPESHTARRIILGICNGLLALHDYTRRCQVVVSCLFESWSCLTSLGLKSVADRYLKPFPLSRLTAGSLVESLVAARMQPAFDKIGKQQPYPTWPFPPSALEEMRNDYPRSVLQKCLEHLTRCVNAGVAAEYPGTELEENEAEDVYVEYFEKTPPDTRNGDNDEHNAEQVRFKDIDACFLKEQTRANAASRKEIVDYGEEFWSQALWCFTQAFCKAQGLLAEANLNATGKDLYADEKYPLHARLQYEAMDDKAEDRDLFLRAFARPHPRSFLAGLGAARKLSGLEHDLPFRRLVLVDLVRQRSGSKTMEELKKLEDSGGFRVVPTDDQIRELAALARTAEAFPAEWEDWVTQNKPMGRCTFLMDHLEWLLGQTGVSCSPLDCHAGQASDGEQSVQVNEPVVDVLKVYKPCANAAKMKAPKGEDARGALHFIDRVGADVSQRIPVGGRMLSGVVTGEATLGLETFKQHVCIVAGSGSGKTVLIKRLVEEAALCGVPSVVVDCGNDLARMGQPWPEKPKGWIEADQKKADEYFERVEVKVWTPGVTEGNPLSLRKIPDLAAYIDNNDELEEAVTVSMNALRGLIPMKDQAREGIAADCLRWMARNGGGDLTTLARILAELPDDCEAHMIDPAKASGMAAGLSSQLRGKMAINPQLKSAATTDISELLLGRNGKTRISVVNLAALGSKQAEQIFVNELAMALFDWIKRNPARGLRGLFVLDEAKDFAPSQRHTPCGESVQRFASQARKYGMGFVMATQEPRSVSNKVVSNCNTQFLGLQNSPADIETAEKLLQKRGVIGKLGRGIFFLKSVEFAGQSFRLATKWCLSNHPPAPPDRSEILHLAKQEL